MTRREALHALEHDELVTNRDGVGPCRVLSVLEDSALIEWHPTDGSGPWEQIEPEPLSDLGWWAP